MNSLGYVKSYRAMFGHWVADDPKTFMAWQEIVHAAAFADRIEELSGRVVELKRGQVNVSDLKSRRHFSDKQWRSFLERLIECGMLTLNSVVRLGRGNGSVSLYAVTAYEKYQDYSEGVSNGPSKGVSNGPSKGVSNNRPEREEVEVGGPSKGPSNGPSKGVSKGPSYIRKEEVKKLRSKEEPPQTPREEEKPKRQKQNDHEFDPASVPLPDSFDRDRFVDFCASRLRRRAPLTEVALKRFVARHESQPAPVLDRMFDNAIVSGWQDLYPLKPQDLEELKAAPMRQGERLPVGSRVEHPTWGADVVRYYTPDGYIVLDDCGAAVQPSEVRLCLN